MVAGKPRDGKRLGDRLDRLQAAAPNLRGVRAIVAIRPGRPAFARQPDLLGSASFAHGLAQLAEPGLAFDLMLEATQLRQAAGLIETLPGLPVAIAHASSPQLDNAADCALWLDGLRRMAALPQVVIKVSALHCRLPGWTDSALCRPITAVIGLFGPDRVAFASDVPVHDQACAFARAYQTFRLSVLDRPAGDQYVMFCGTARRVYRI